MDVVESTNGYRKNRAMATTNAQLSVYVQYIQEHPDIIAPGKNGDLVAQLWKELSSQMNAVGSGPVKSAKDWHVTLRNWRNTVRHKERRLRLETNSDPPTKPLTAIEQLALKLWNNPPDSEAQYRQDPLCVGDRSQSDQDDEPIKTSRGAYRRKTCPPKTIWHNPPKEKEPTETFHLVSPHSRESLSNSSSTSSYGTPAAKGRRRSKASHHDDAKIFGDFIASSIRQLATKGDQMELTRSLTRALLAYQDAQIAPIPQTF